MKQIYITKNKITNEYYVSEKPIPTNDRREFPNINDLVSYLRGDDFYLSGLKKRSNVKISLLVPRDEREGLEKALRQAGFKKAEITVRHPSKEK